MASPVTSTAKKLARTASSGHEGGRKPASSKRRAQSAAARRHSAARPARLGLLPLFAGPPAELPGRPLWLSKRRNFPPLGLPLQRRPFLGWSQTTSCQPWAVRCHTPSWQPWALSCRGHASRQWSLCGPALCLLLLDLWPAPCLPLLGLQPAPIPSPRHAPRQRPLALRASPSARTGRAPLSYRARLSVTGSFPERRWHRMTSFAPQCGTRSRLLNMRDFRSQALFQGETETLSTSPLHEFCV